MTRVLLSVVYFSLILRDFCVATAVASPPPDGSSGDKLCLGSDVSSCSNDDDYNEDHEDDDELDSSTGEDRPLWWTYSIDDLFEELLSCGGIIYGYDMGDDAESPDPTWESEIQKIMQQWNALREKYTAEVNLVPVQTPTPENDYSTMTVPVKVGDAGPDKGRGVFAAGRIEKGSLVMSLDAGNVGIFKDGHSWRKFVATLPRETACNFIEWCWIQTVRPAHSKDDGSRNGVPNPPENEIDDDIRNGLTIFVTFDESNLMNNADWDSVEANVRCGLPPSQEGDDWGPCRFHYHAARDIEAGEELLTSYGDFEDTDQSGWTDIGL